MQDPKDFEPILAKLKANTDAVVNITTGGSPHMTAEELETRRPGEVARPGVQDAGAPVVKWSPRSLQGFLDCSSFDRRRNVMRRSIPSRSVIVCSSTADTCAAMTATRR